jgi:hypothetical protein
MEALGVILLYALISLLICGLGLFLYLRSVASRRTLTCPQCGEVQTVELMNATHCNTCGAPYSTSTN